MVKVVFVVPEMNTKQIKNSEERVAIWINHTCIKEICSPNWAVLSGLSGRGYVRSCGGVICQGGWIPRGCSPFSEVKRRGGRRPYVRGYWEEGRL